MKKGTASTFILILVLLIGLSLLLYPSFSNYWNELHQTRAIANYADAVASLEKDDYSAIWESAVAFNDSLLTRFNRYTLTEEQQALYDGELNVSGNGIMAYIEIPVINVYLPIYHGTSESVLQVAVGHLDWTSLPTGGASTHCVVSGHRGLPSAELFSKLDKLIVGDVFMIHVLDETLTYEVDQILVVEPDETQDLLIEEGKDLFTLVTCTPYGINTHRLLVRGHRVENAKEEITVRVVSDAVQIEPLIIASILGIGMMVLLVMIAIIADGFKPKKKS